MDILEQRVRAAIRDIPDFPKPGILFKDITPIFQDHKLCSQIISCLAGHFANKDIHAVAGIESRGFLFGTDLARTLAVPFIPIRKKGKLPYETISHKYELEYGYSEIEMHSDAIKSGMRVLIHDDLLATGGTAIAAAELIKKMNAEVAGFSFLIDLTFLDGTTKLKPYTEDVHIVVRF